MGFTETGAAVEEEGVITVTGGVDDTAGGGDSEVVIRADDEIIEGVFLVKTGFVGSRVFFRGRSESFNTLFNDGVGSGDFAGTDFRFCGRFYLESKFDDFDLVVFKRGSNKVVIAVTKLFNIESVFNADFNVTVFSREKGSVLEPGGKISSGNLLFDFSKCVFPNVVHVWTSFFGIYYSMEGESFPQVCKRKYLCCSGDLELQRWDFPHKEKNPIKSCGKLIENCGKMRYNMKRI